MITGFEPYTHDLTELELKAVPIIVSGLVNKVGKDKAITSTIIIEKMNASDKCDVKLTGARLRKIINYIRIKRLIKFLCSNSNGYFVAASSYELNEYIKSLDERISSITAVRKSFNN